MEYNISQSYFIGEKENKMKFNVRPSDCKFIVDEEKKTVVCIYENCSHDFINFINDNCEINFYSFDMYSNAKQKLYNKMLMPNRFMGIAKCSEDDEWNEETGRLIAFSRMKDKLNKSFFKRANAFFNTIDRWLDEINELIDKIGEKMEINQQKRHKYIENLIKDR